MVLILLVLLTGSLIALRLVLRQRLQVHLTELAEVVEAEIAAIEANVEHVSRIAADISATSQDFAAPAPTRTRRVRPALDEIVASESVDVDPLAMLGFFTPAPGGSERLGEYRSSGSVARYQFAKLNRIATEYQTCARSPERQTDLDSILAGDSRSAGVFLAA